MDYVYHYYNNWDHGTYGQSSSSIPSSIPSSSSFTGHCSCTCFTCLYKLDLLLLLIVIYLMLMDKITININSSTITTTTTRLPLVPVNDNGTIINVTPSTNMSNIVTSTTESISSSPSSSISSSPNKSLSSSSSSTAAFVKVKTSLINSSLPWESMIITKTHGGETLINSERSTPSDPPESLPDSLNSFCSYGSLRRKLIKPDISLDFLDSSSDDDDDDDDENDKSSKSKKKSSDDGDTDSLEECNVFSGCANDEHFYRDASLSEETFTNDRMIVHPSSIHCS